MKHASQCGVGSNENKSTNVIINTLVQYFTMVTSFQMEKKKQLLLVNNFVLLFFFMGRYACVAVLCTILVLLGLTFHLVSLVWASYWSRHGTWMKSVGLKCCH